MFQSSALVSAHIESVTLPMRFAPPIFRYTVLKGLCLQVKTGFGRHFRGSEPIELEERHPVRSIERSPSR